MLPGAAGLAAVQEGRPPSWAGLARQLERDGVEVVDLGPALARRDAQEPGRLWAPGGHYSAAGNRCVAETLAELDVEPGAAR